MNCDFIKKWSEYYTCKECKDEVNRKGHLTKLQEAVHVDNFRKIIFNLRNSITLSAMHRVWQMMKKSDEHKVAADARNIFLRKKIIQHQVQYHVLNMKKVIFLRKIMTKHIT